MSAIDERVLDAEIIHLERELAAQESMFERSRDRVQVLRAQLEGFNSFRARLLQKTPGDQVGSRSSRPSAGPANTTCRAAILRLLESTPSGLMPAQIADALENQIHSKSKNRRHAILTALCHLRQAGKVVRDEETGQDMLPGRQAETE